MQSREKQMHLEHENGLKPHFSPFLALIRPILGPRNFFQPLDHHQVLQIITAYHNTQNREKLMRFEQENGLKPHFGPFLALKWPIWANTFFSQKSKNYTYFRLS